MELFGLLQVNAHFLYGSVRYPGPLLNISYNGRLSGTLLQSGAGGTWVTELFFIEGEQGES